MKKIIEGKIAKSDVDVEDSGCAVICHVDDGTYEDNGVFVRLQSWSEEGTGHNRLNMKEIAKCHPKIVAFIGKRVRVTIETLD